MSVSSAKALAGRLASGLSVIQRLTSKSLVPHSLCMRIGITLLVAGLVVFLFAAGSASPKHGHRDDSRLTPLMTAAARNNLPGVQKLLRHGADVRQRTTEGETALYEAIEWRDTRSSNLPVVDALLKAGADPNEREIYAMSALEVSLTRDHHNPAVTLRLLQAGSIVLRDCGEGDSLVSLATQDSSLEVMQVLFRRGAPVNCRFRGASALYWAAVNGQADKVKLLLQSGADPTIRFDGKTMLNVATSMNPDRRVQASFEQTRTFLQEALDTITPSK